MARKTRGKPRARRLGLVERLSRWVFRKIFGLVWWIGLRVTVVTGLVLGGATLYFYAQLPPMQDLMDGRDRGSVTLLDRSGDVFAWRGDQYQVVRAESASPHLVNAVVATEDKRFYSHFGLDPKGITRAMVQNLRAGRMVQGGSTITQQTAKMVFFNNARTLERKLKEIPAALAMELKYSKQDILSIYLNRAYLGAGSQGFEAASQRYFAKSAREVGPAEAAMLAGLLKAPSRYAPTTNLSVAQGRAEVIVGLMEDQGLLTRIEADLARANPAQLSQRARARTGGAFADWVMEAGPAFLTKSTTEDVEIQTTFDPRIQRAAEAALQEVFETKVRDGSKAQAAIVVLSPDGAVRAMVGGRGTGNTPGQFNRAVQALRQPGSAFKTLVYAAGLETGMSPNDTFYDAPITLEIAGSGPWSPQNYDRKFRGEVTLTDAFASSINTVAVKVAERVGRERVRALAQDFGMTTKLAKGPALALGVSETTLLQLTGAYAGILNGGRRSTPYGMLELKLRGENLGLMGADRQDAFRVMDQRAAGHMVYMMRQVVERGSGVRARLEGRPAAGKTGTTQAARDAWFVGFTGDYVAGVWMGYDDNTPLKGVTGSGLPAEIWQNVMSRIHQGLPVTPLPEIVPPAPQVVAEVAPSQGGRPQAPRAQDRAAENVLRSVLRGLLGQ
ncbi:MAG: PBP1A family penicillin-binding protein [Pseudomonadota bacterium]